ncbi:MAG: hypothetical protein P8O16_09715 [Algoriphagus sp.]|uniref:hypothetical protein n=1 Tax=Algoriphagus sp. TaxID=1872435 RepID=UPI0026127221|nr:hypothetical protein [Algoriphagus sp.]MDG1277545.1 hypothetical protein [Algoriphagus sp.]
MNGCIEKMKADYDSLEIIPLESYHHLLRYLILKKVKRGTILKEPGKADTCSRYICEGKMGFYLSHDGIHRLESVFTVSDTVFDRYSYLDGSETDHLIKALTTVTFFELSKIGEGLVIKNLPEFHFLANKVPNRINQRLAFLQLMKVKKLKSGYFDLISKFPDLHEFLTQSDIAGFFNVDVKTVNRFLNEEHP